MQAFGQNVDHLKLFRLWSMDNYWASQFDVGFYPVWFRSSEELQSSMCEMAIKSPCDKKGLTEYPAKTERFS